LYFIHKGSSLMFKFLSKERKLNYVYECQKKWRMQPFGIPQVYAAGFSPSKPRRDLIGFLMEGKSLALKELPLKIRVYAFSKQWNETLFYSSFYPSAI
jgi:hypothetical protein